MSKIILSEPQSIAIIDPSSSVGVVAGFGSGKTKIALEKAFFLLHNAPGVPVAYGAPTYDLINSIFYPAVEEHCEKYKIACDINKSKNVIHMPGLGNIICRSLSNPSKLVGWECGTAILDEFDILPAATAKEAWLKMKARCRSKYPKFTKERFKHWFKKKRFPNQMFAVSTPEGFKTFYELFENDPLPKSRLIRMSTYDNIEHLPKGYIKELKSNYPPQLVEAYIMGRFVNLASGAVYPTFSRKKNDTSITPLPREILHVGMDFNVQKMAAIVHVIRDSQPIAVGELHSILDTPAMIGALRDLYPGHTIYVYPDATGGARQTVNASESDISLLRGAGLTVIVNYSNPRVKDRLVTMNAMFHNMEGERRYLINVKECPEYTKCLERQAYDKNGLPDKQSDLDHMPDAGGYFISKQFGISKPIARKSTLTM